MPIVPLNGQLLVVRLSILPTEIPHLLSLHTARYPGAHNLEAAANALVLSKFEPAVSAAFVKSVCEWGGGHRQIGRILSNNSRHDIAAALQEGFALAIAGSVPEGVKRLCGLRNLGQSFASKQIRFLAPSRAVILDSVIRTRLGYAETVKGYADFLGDCQQILESVRTSNQLEERQAASLRICDIEAAIFTKLQGY